MVRYERSGAAALLTIDRPERRNAVDGPTAAALLEGYERFAADVGAAVLVLTGAGEDAFCAGADLKAIAEAGPEVPPELVEAVAERTEGPMGFTRLTASKPTIAAISGWCLAGGLELALWCDLRVATDSARLGFTERRFGVPLIDGGTQRLPRAIGMARALDLILTGRMVGAEEAARIGLVTELVPHGRHLSRALELAEALAAFPQETLRSDRQAALEGFGLPLAEGLAHETGLGRERAAAALVGAARFARGEGRGGAGV